MARDEGTADLRRHKLAVVNGSADPALSASLSGILLAHAILTPAQHQAADRFRRARAAAFGVVLGDRDPNRPEVSEAAAGINERRYERMLARLSTDQQLACVDLILDLRPSWARRAVLGLPLTDNDQAERGHLLAGLDRLAGDSPVKPG